MVRRLLLIVLLALAPTLAGCSSGDTSSSGSTPSAATSGENWVEIADMGVRFQIPKDWETITPDDVAGAAADAPSIQDFADRMGITADQFTQMVQQAALWAFAPQATNGFADNLNVIDLGDTEVVTEAEARSQLGSIGATLSGYETISTGVGEGARYTYSLDTGRATIAGTGLAVKVDGHVLLITYSTAEAAAGATASDLAVSTLEAT